MMIDKRYLYSDLTEIVIGCSMKVHRHFGSGFQEVIYKRALALELKKSGIPCAVEVEKDIYYQDIFIGKRRMDMIIDNKILLELKAVSALDRGFYSQALNYLKIFGLEVGLLINFGADSLQFRRLAHSK